ncbi:glycosyl hydrolase family 65 protein [Pontiellaceae bacterium B12227]|nr:glycosyl hydrolase family 65 protein [Pontiellaceae bacterium B12227]
MFEKNNDDVWYASGDAWELTVDQWEPEKNVYFETIFSQANGYMGFRGYREECDNAAPSLREGYLAGLFSKLPPLARRMVVHDYPWDSKQMVSLPEIFSAWVALDGETFNLTTGKIGAYRQSLDMRTGVLTRSVRWTSPFGNTTNLTFIRFLSTKTPNLAVQRIEAEPVNWSGSVEIIWEYNAAQPTYFRCGDPAKQHVACPHCAVLETSGKEETVAGLVALDGTPHRIAYASRVEGDGSATSFSNEGGLLSQTVRHDLTIGQSGEWSRYTAVATTRDGAAQPEKIVAPLVSSASYGDFLDAQAAVWSERWADADIEIEGNARDQVLVRFGIFSLLQIAPFHADNLSVPARCYAYNRYNGLYFWDGEIFLLPFYQFSAPEVGRNMLRFRCKTLPGARRNAELLKADGAIFPWQGDADEGLEQAPWGLYEYLWHQNADIVYAFDQYARATGDDAFMIGEGLEVLAETARFWISKLELGEDGKYHLDGTVGPDEAEEHGPDNGYTCLMAQRSLEISHRWWMQAGDAAAVLAESLDLGADEIAEWKAVASKINVPEVPGCPGVPLQDAFFLGRKAEDISEMTVAEYWQKRSEVQVIKQADIVLAMYLLEDRFSRGEIRRGYEFYEPKTLHVSSLSYNTHSIVAAIIGNDEQAYDYFRKAAGLDLDNLRNATKDGLHAASLGGVWQMAIAGFMGMRVREDHIYFQPALPKAWKRIRFPLRYRGWKLDFSVDAEVCRVAVSGEGAIGATMVVGEQRFELSDGMAVEIALNIENKLVEKLV